MIGELINHYRILEKLGSGGMGEVYKAEDTTLKRFVALKFLPYSLSIDDEAKHRLFHEAQSASTLQHNNICTIHEISETEDDQLFICMDFYEGETLAQKIKRGPIKIDDVINYTIQIAEGLYKAHQKNIIHRDIKPGNIFITNDNVVKILDFGLAKSSDQTQLTQYGKTFGTIKYMSPEQTLGGTVDKRSDIWALGVIMFEMLIGEHPFKGDYDQAVIYSILNEEPQSITEINQNIPSEFEKIISKLLSKDKEKRYSSLYDLIIDLKEISGIKYSKLQYYFHSNKKVLFITSAVILFISFLVLILLNANSEQFPITKKSISILAFENQTGDTTYNYLKIAVPNLLITNLEQSRLFSVTTWERLKDLLRQTGGKNISDISQEEGFKLCKMDNVKTIAFGSITKAGNYFATDVKLLDVDSKKLISSVSAKGEGVESILISQIDKLSKIIASDISETKDTVKILPIPAIELTTNSLEAYNYYLRGLDDYFTTNRWESVENFLRAIKIDSNFAMAYNYLGIGYLSIGKLAESKSAFEKALQLSKNLSYKERLFIEGQYALYITDSVKKALDIYEKLSIEFPKDIEILRNKAICLSPFADKEKTIQTFKKILDLDPLDVALLNRLGYMYLTDNLPDSSKLYFEKQLKAYPNNANSYHSFGEYYLINGNLKAAEECFNKASNINEYLRAHTEQLAYLSALQDNFDTSKQLIQYEIDHETEIYKIDAINWLAYYEYLTRNYKKSFDLLDSAKQIAIEINNKDHIAIYHYLSAWFYLTKNDLKNAENHFKELRTYPNYRTDNLIFLCNLNMKLNRLDSIPTYIANISNNLSELNSRQNIMIGNHIKSALDYIKAELLLNQNKPKKVLNITLENYISTEFIYWDFGTIRENLPFEKDVKARSYVKMNQINNAVKEYENLIYRKNTKYKFWINNPIYHYRLAKLYEQQNQLPKALNEYKIFHNICKDGDKSDDIIIDCKNRIDKLSKFQ